MAESKRPLVIGADLYTDYTEEVPRVAVIIKLDLPQSFDFERDGKKLLRQIKAGANLFSGEPEAQ